MQAKDGESGTASNVLGITRLPLWRLDDFVEDLASLLRENGKTANIMLEDIKDGAEDMIDVYVRFGTELEAGLFKRIINGSLFRGRKVNADFA